MEFCLQMFLLFSMVYLILYPFFKIGSYNIWMWSAKGWDKMAIQADLNAKALYDSTEYDNPKNDYEWDTHNLRVKFLIGWNNDVIRYQTLANNLYDKVPKWYQKLYNRFNKDLS